MTGIMQTIVSDDILVKVHVYDKFSWSSEAYLESSRRSTMERFLAKIVTGF